MDDGQAKPQQALTLDGLCKQCCLKLLLGSKSSLPKSLCLGPLLLLPNFDLDAIRTCSMHNVNLGLLFTANGSALLSGLQVQVFVAMAMSLCIGK